jgi:carboxypeptidase family protein
MNCGTSKIALALLSGLVIAAPYGQASGVPALSGELLGQVQNSAGIAQMGATIFLYNRYDQLVRQALTNDSGKFAFDALAPDLYSIRVVLASFVPAVRRNISIAAGSESLLKINLASVLSTVELMPASAAQGTLMTDDWKWVLRSSAATRPVLRFTPVASSSRRRSTLAKFSETSGVIRLSAGDGDSVSGSTAQDLGTSFALATRVNGSARIRLSGNVGYMANSGLPTAGFRTTYAADKDNVPGPQIALTAHQVYFPGLGADGNPANDQSGPVLRTAAFSAIDKIDLLDSLRLEYGGHMESVSFLHRVTYVSPFARATYDFGPKGSLRVAYSAGTQPSELIERGSQTSDGAISPASDLNQDLAALSLLPRVSRSNGHMRLQRTETWEAGYEIKDGTRKYSVSAYIDNLADATYNVSGTLNSLPQSDLLPDFDSSSYVFDIGNYHRSGYTAAVTQSVGDRVDFTLAAGRGGALVADPQQSAAASSADLRGLVRKTQRSWLSARASATLPGSGTQIVTSYGWTDFRSLMPVHLSLTGITNQDEGWNIMLRQPLPRFNGLRGRLEATAEMRNALAQGYLPLNAGGAHAVLTNSPRALRGGLSFLF